MIPSFDPALWRRASWTVLTLAVAAFVCLGLAEQGSRGGGLLIPPDSPLPFERQRVFGLNLDALSSVDALNWLNAAGNPNLALMVLPVDADVVQSLALEDQRENGLAGIETLRAAAGGSPLAFCLRRPAETVGGLAIAQAAVESIKARFPDQVIYVRACDPDAVPGWQGNIDEAARPDAEVRASDDTLIPLAGGPLITLDAIDNVRELDPDRLSLNAHDRYTIYSFEASEPLSTDDVERVAGALADTSHTALVFVAPIDGVDPAALISTIAPVALAGDELPEGFSGVKAPAMQINDGWQHSTVGTTQYLRAAASGAALEVEFVGTDISLIAVESPDSGLINVWLDPASQTAPPTAILDLSSTQARDSAIPVATGLPAAHHRLIMQVVTEEGQSVTISGLFVTGKPPTAWTVTMAAAVVLLAAVAALSERCYTAIAAIRRRSGPPRRRSRTGHPRVFARDR
ncbi:MAG TPA: hypothetical protein VFV93_01010 [Thermomicrobiales bacterium]|nr:hypothetical protein [Thermomicrobiales bacterium]